MTEQGHSATFHALMQRYIDLFNASDFETALSECYLLPFSWLVGPNISTALSPADFVAHLSTMRAGLADDGLERSELLGCTVRMMGPNVALVGVEVARHYADGREAEVSGGTYVAHGNGENWRLALLIAHPIEDIVT